RWPAAERRAAVGPPAVSPGAPGGAGVPPVARRPVDPPGPQYLVLGARGTRGIDRGPAVAGARRPADDPAIDEFGAGRLDDRRDALGGLRADRIAIDVDGLLRQGREGRSQLARQALGLAGRQDRQEEIGTLQQ